MEKKGKATKDVFLHNIRPVKIADLCRFQMPTPLSASASKLEYSGAKGGGIDILARTGQGRGTCLSVMELKQGQACKATDAAMSQALAYGVFIQELLASECGRDWFNIFGFSANQSLNRPRLKVVTVMQYGDTIDQRTGDPMVLDTARGALEFHYIYLDNGLEQALRVKSSSIFRK